MSDKLNELTYQFKRKQYYMMIPIFVFIIVFLAPFFNGYIFHPIQFFALCALFIWAAVYSGIFQKSKQKLEQDIKEAVLSQCGVSLLEVRTQIKPNRFSLCLVRGLLIFMASYGTIAGLVSAFELPFHFLAVTLGILIVSMLAAFLYFNRITFYAGYFILFFAFAFFSFVLYPFINSGFQAFTNEVYQKYGDFFYLDVVREANELIANRYLTVSVTMVFLGLMMAILLNITISAHMNFPETLLITFLPLQIALYIDRIPAVPYLAMLLGAYITVGILGRSSHYSMNLKTKNVPFFSVQLKKGRIHYSYQTNSRGILTLSIYSFLFSVLFLLLCNGLFFHNLQSKGTSNVLKNTTDAYVKTYIQSGFWGFLDRYESTGGLSNGKLGGASSVSPDYQTDLVVTFVPYATDTVYLKGYTGVTYSNNLFSTDYDILQEVPTSGTFRNQNYARMSISVMDHNYTMPGQVYPYDTLKVMSSDSDTPISSDFLMEVPSDYPEHFEEEPYVQAFTWTDQSISDYEIYPQDAYETYDVIYLPYISQTYYEPNPAISADYEAMVYQNYLQIPEELIPTLNDFCAEAGLTELNEMINSAETYEEKQQARLAVASRLRSYFVQEFPYTMSPGSTPRGEDTIAYFLTEQRRGFCAHFASSATLLLRSMGIPARYVEGYCITFSDLTEATAITESTEGWYFGENSMDNTGLVTVNVTDGSAHAWVEIYLDGYGWIPFEMTPPAFGDTLTDSNLLSLFSGLFTPAQRIGENVADGMELPTATLPKIAFLSSIKFVATPFLWIILILFGILLLFLVRDKIIFSLQLQNALLKRRYRDALLLCYRNTIRKLKKSKILTSPNPLFRDVEKAISENYSISRESLDAWISRTELAAFGQTEITKEDFIEYRKFIKELNRGNKKKTGKQKK